MPRDYRVLLIDDEFELLRALSVRLTSAGFRCQMASNGAEGLAKVKGFSPELVITDLLMPEIDGYELCRRLRMDPQTATTPVIVLTAVPKPELDTKIKALGATWVLCKPFDFPELLSIVQGILGPSASEGGTTHG